MLRRAYDLDNGLYTEQYAKDHPYAAIEAHAAETNAYNGLFFLYAERYERYNVYDRFHISLTEFVSYGPEDCEWMIKYCEQRQAEERKAAEDAQNKSKSKIITGKEEVEASMAAIRQGNLKGGT
jgi:hypothetical protein